MAQFIIPDRTETKEMRYQMGYALSDLASEYENVVALDADLRSSTGLHIFEHFHPDKLIKCGIALLAPFDNGRYFFPWRPIQVSPIGLHGFFTEFGLTALRSEILWIWLPLMGTAGLALLRRMRRVRQMR